MHTCIRAENDTCAQTFELDQVDPLFRLRLSNAMLLHQNTKIAIRRDHPNCRKVFSELREKNSGHDLLVARDGLSFARDEAPGGQINHVPMLHANIVETGAWLCEASFRRGVEAAGEARACFLSLYIDNVVKTNLRRQASIRVSSTETSDARDVCMHTSAVD
jgi:hypothetical protein